MRSEVIAKQSPRLPNWLRRRLPENSTLITHEILNRYHLNTVCEAALCPNRNECYSAGTATFMILGKICTRRCGFCAVPAGKTEAVQADEPERVAKAALALELKYVVVTSVARDDLKDQGAGHFARTILALKEYLPQAEIEILTPDFRARRDLIAEVAGAGPAVYNHNLETVRSLQPKVRPQASYERSLAVLEIVKGLHPEMLTKSGLMLGLGESDEEIFETASDLRSRGCDILTLGQYLRPDLESLEVEEYVAPARFARWASDLKGLGFREVYAGPYVRSSYHAGEVKEGGDFLYG